MQSNGLKLLVFACLTIFFVGFLLEVYLLPRNLHPTAPRHIRSDQLKSPANISIEKHLVSINKDDLNRLFEVEKLYMQQHRELNELKEQVERHPFVEEPDVSAIVKVGAEKNLLDIADTSSGLRIESNVPHVVSAWREAKLDWHLLLPKHLSKWERFGPPPDGAKLSLLVSKEIQITDYLTRFHESGLAAKYGLDHGNMQSYSACDAFSTGCLIHDSKSCLTNRLCSWNKMSNSCEELSAETMSTISSNINSLDKNQSQTTCSKPQQISIHGAMAVSPSKCSFWVHQPAVLFFMDSEAQSMFYHWWSSWTTIYNFWKHELHGHRDFHTFIYPIDDPMFFHYFGLISDFCWRRQTNQVPAGTCFCDVRNFASSQSLVDATGAASYLIKQLGLAHVTPPPHRVKIGIISRRRKRFILNEYDLVRIIEEQLGYECVLLPLETMTMYEQMRELRSLDVLIGIHGSALDNSIFLHKGSVIVHLLPYKVEHRVSFPEIANQAGVVYLEWQSKNPSNSVFHWDLFRDNNKEKFETMSKEEILQQGQASADTRETTMFWINQDIIIPHDEWIDVVVKAVRNSRASSRHFDINPRPIH